LGKFIQGGGGGPVFATGGRNAAGISEALANNRICAIKHEII
jgi:hypothetical protein